jgi:hypothetical protein
MPDDKPDRLDRLFGELATTELPVPSPAGVVARGRQRRRNTRIMASVAGLAVVALAGSATAYVHHVSAHRAVAPQSHRSPHPAPSAATLPPAGSGPLVLGVDYSGPVNKLVMIRIGKAAKPVSVPGLQPMTDAVPVIATNPAGGWIVSSAAGTANAAGQRPTRLATVSTSGVIRLFGPAFGRQVRVTAIDVRPDGSAVAVAISHTLSEAAFNAHRARPAAQIELVPMPGYQAAIRTWTLGNNLATIAMSLSWKPDGTRLTYIPGSDATGGGFAPDGAITFSTLATSDLTPAVSGWPPPAKGVGTCNLNAGAWDGSSDNYLALKGCDSREILGLANAATGSSHGPTVTVPGFGCPAGGPLDPQTHGSDVLIMWCGVYLDSGNHIAIMPGSLDDAAWAGGE